MVGSGRQLADDDSCVGAREGRDDVAGAVAGHAAVAVLTGLAVDLEAVPRGRAENQPFWHRRA